MHTPSRPTLAICSFLSQSRSSVIKLVAYYRAIGARHIYLFFDYPEEADFPEFSSSDDVTIVPCDDGFWANCPYGRSDTLIDRNEYALLQGYTLATAAGYDFAALVDGDELLYVQGDISKVLAEHAPHADVLRLYPYEAVHGASSRSEKEFSQRLFKSLPNAFNRHFMPLVYGNAFRFSDDGFFAHLSGKPILRTGLTYERINVHSPMPKEPARIRKIENIWLLHFDCMNFESWKRKWALRMNGKSIGTMREKRAMQFDAIKAAFDTGDDAVLDSLYSSFFVLPKWRVALGRLTGLLRKPQELDRLL